MANNDWVNRTTKRHIEHTSPSKMTELFGGSFVDGSGNANSTADWIFNPDLSAVTSFATKYWIITGDLVALMSQAERDAVDAAELVVRRDAVADTLDQIEDILRAFALVVLDEINLLREQFNTTTAESIDLTTTTFADRTIAQIKTAVRGKLGS